MKLREQDESILAIYSFVQAMKWEQSGRDAINEDLKNLLERGIHTQEQHDEMHKQLDEIDEEINGGNK